MSYGITCEKCGMKQFFERGKPYAWLCEYEGDCSLYDMIPRHPNFDQRPTFTQADLDAAVRAEREACASVARNMLQMWETACANEYDPHLDGMADAAEIIEAAIRERKP